MNDIIEKVKDELTFENVLIAAMKSPGVKINREKFLKKELIKFCSEEQVEEAIRTNPAKAGISKKIINNLSKTVIDYESLKVTSLSIAASLPGGGWAVGAAAADITSYFAFVLRVVQELAYLYGFAEFDLKEENVDSETMQTALVFIGVMFSVQGATTALKKFADTFAGHVAKKLAQKALMKTAYYPIVKKIASKVGIEMTKQIFADTVASAIPIVGGVLSGGLTYIMFKPNCNKLRKNLMSYNLCDPEYYKKVDAGIIDVDVEEL